MALRYKHGDISEAKEDMIIHGCNAQGIMGSGVAKAIRAKWPSAYVLYREEYLDKGLRLGEVKFVTVYPKQIIANAITQEFFGNDGKVYADPLAIEACLIKAYSHLNVRSYAMPKIGCGLGGLDWDTDVEPIVRQLFEHSRLEMVIYEFD